jgi:hypothetical protein
MGHPNNRGERLHQKRKKDTTRRYKGEGKSPEHIASEQCKGGGILLSTELFTYDKPVEEPIRQKPRTAVYCAHISNTGRLYKSFPGQPRSA